MGSQTKLTTVLDDTLLTLMILQLTQQALQIKEVLNFTVKAEEIQLKEKQSCKVVYNITSDYSPEEIKSSCFHERGNQLEVLEVTRLKRKVANQMLENELNMAIQNLKTPSTPGIDNLDNLGLIKSPEKFRTRILMGAILSPLLFLTFISDLKTSTTIDIRSMFADDLLTCHKSSSIEEASNSAQITLQEICQYSKNNGVPLSTKKTKVTVFHRKRNTLANPEIRVSGKILEAATSAKNLGVHFDKRQGIEVKFEHVPSHCGIKRNEVADETAQQAADCKV
ncbi:hypothetical protein QYM36_004307 [Artemia franciscana]|uniref:Reverse transcriptase domain-containing protein n=1 Tax=Artemia franciscana TaxID=6661 RepID=A0AA88IEJ9_ARTSF|nr:hypothetical protein QYM36_004307 [Artemia franciscana]